MDRLGDVTFRKALLLLGAFIVLGGFALALLSNLSFGTFGSFSATHVPAQSNDMLVGSSYSRNILATFGGSGSSYSGITQVISSASTETSTTYGGQGTFQTNSTSTQGAPSGAGGMIEFSSQLGIQSPTPQKTASEVVALAYSVGGYVAYQSTYPTSAYVVIRVPALDYQSTLTQVEAMGTVTSLVSNSNDVRVQYTDLNSTLASLRTEQGALLRLLNQSSSISTTLSIESQLQGVNQQINDIESQILQTKTLIEFATVNVTISEAPQLTPLSMLLSATPKNGSAPLSVTFNAVVKGGAQPYVINYNFGDGDSVQGQIVIHTYYQAGTYKVTVTATDQNGTVAQASTAIKVEAAEGQSSLSAFFGTVANLFFGVVGGIVEVAVVVLPIAAVGAAVVLPFRRTRKPQAGIKQSQ